MKNLLLSCEHGGYDIPTNYKRYFEGHKAKLRTHRGWDPGALELAKLFQSKLQATFYFSTISRLLIEQNRTLSHPELFSYISNDFTEIQKIKLKEEIYQPYVDQIDNFIKKQLKVQPVVLHLSVHSFTPKLDGVKRDADVGILFDPKNKEEAAYAELWMHAILEKMPTCKVKFNYPYQGTDDGLTNYFRNKYHGHYAGIELEVNNQLFEDYSMDRLGNILMPPRS